MGRSALTDNAAAKAAAQDILRKGLATYQEIAALSGVSRQTIRFWAVELGAESAREKHLTKLWRDALRQNK
jgi:predicted transcriptional regulator